ncbi:MAG: response regulator, partial [Planctomycetota bacterium]
QGEPGCVVTDLRMYGMSGVELQQRLAQQGFHIPVIVITAYASTPVTVKAIKQGAITLLEKPCDDQDLWDAIVKALGQDDELCERKRTLDQIDQRYSSLTADERVVLSGICDGQPNKAIAHDQGVTERTIETRRRNVFRKMKVSGITELVKVMLIYKDERGTDPGRQLLS